MATTLPRTGGARACADCSAVEPTWALLNRGLLICHECAGVHRSLGRHLSQLRSLKKGHWNSSQLALLHALHGNGANSIWEAGLLTAANAHARVGKPTPNDPVYPTKADFIRAKYANLSFVLRPPKEDGPLNLADLNRQLWSCVRTAHVETTLRLLALGAEPNYAEPDRGTSPLHVAAKEAQPLQVELLALYGADPAQPDLAGQRPADVAAAEKHKDLALRLRQLEYEATDRLSLFLCGKRAEHASGHHFLIPELASGPDVGSSSLGRGARNRLRALNGGGFEKMVGDVYDEVDRRETDAAWSESQKAPLLDRFVVPFLPVNPDFTATRNQSRQKLAKFSAKEFAFLLISVLGEARRRAGGDEVAKTASAELLAQPSRPEPARRAVKSDSSLPLRGASSSGDDLEEAIAEVDEDGEDYDEVAADYAVVRRAQSKTPTSRRPTTDLEEVRALRDQLATTEDRVFSLSTSNEVILRQLDKLNSTVSQLIEEKAQLKRAQPAHNQAKKVNGSAPSAGSEEEIWQRRDEARAFGASPRPAKAPLTSATAFHSTARATRSPGVDGASFPASVVAATEALTRQIQGLLVEAQAGRLQAFARHAAGIQATVDRLVGLVPPERRDSDRDVDAALNAMVDHCISLTVQCSKDPSPGRQEALSCQVVQAAYDVAKSAKQLMGSIQATD